MKPWYRSKAIWTSVAMVVYAVAGYAVGELETMEALRTVLEACGLGTLRLGIGNIGRAA